MCSATRSAMHVTWGLNMIRALYSPTTGSHLFASYTIIKMSHSVIKHQIDDGLETFFQLLEYESVI